MTEEEVKEELIPTEEPKEEVQEKEPDRGTDFLDFKTATTEEIEARFRRIYHNMKESGNRADEAIGFAKKMGERIAVLERTQDEVINSGEISDVKTALIKAKEAGDITSEVDLTTRLTRLASMKPKEAPPEDPTQDVGVSEHDVAVMQAWANETDEEGNLVRPYAQENSPQLRHIAALGQSITLDPQFAGASMEEVLAEVDRKMVKRKATGVIDPADNKGGKKGKSVKLSADQKYVAGKLGVSEADYAKNIGAGND